MFVRVRLAGKWDWNVAGDEIIVNTEMICIMSKGNGPLGKPVFSVGFPSHSIGVDEASFKSLEAAVEPE